MFREQDLLKEISSAIAQAEQLTEKIQIPVEIAESTPGAGDNYTINVEYDIPMSVASLSEEQLRELIKKKENSWYVIKDSIMED